MEKAIPEGSAPGTCAVTSKVSVAGPQRSRIASQRPERRING